MTRRIIDLHAARAGRPRRADAPFGAWAPDGDDAVADDALRDLLLRTDLYERVGDPLTPEGVVACAAGLTGLLAGGGTCRLILAAPVLDTDGLWDRQTNGDATNAALRVALERSWADPEAREALDLIGYLVSRGRATVGMCLVSRARTDAIDLRVHGHPHAAWAIATDGPRRVLLLPEAPGRHRVAGRDADPAAEAASASFADLWAGNKPSPYTDNLPPTILALLRDRGERNVRPREPRMPPTDPAGRSFEPMEVLRFAILRDAPTMPGGRLIGVESAPVAAWPHQAAVARRLVEGFPRSWMLADEVGLGKTIECGLALRSLLLSRTCARVLVTPPASLCAQWQRELESKFALPFAVADASAGARLYEPDRLIVSRSLVAATEPGRAAALAAARPWDVVVADEAHGARRGTNLAAAIGGSLRPRCASLVLSTATPMQLRARDAFDLNRWLGRGGAFDGDDVLAESYYAMLEDLPERGGSEKRLDTVQRELLRATLREFREIDPAEWRRSWSDVTLKCRDDIQAEILAFVDGRIDAVAGRANRYVRQLAYAAAPLGRTMMRHGRAILRHYEEHDLIGGRRLPRRTVRALALPLDDRARAFGSLLEAYLAGLSRRLGARSRRSARGAAFYASFLRLRAASSETAIRRTLARRQAKVAACLAAAAIRESALSEIGEAVLGDHDVAVEGGDGLLKDRTPEDLSWEAERLDELVAALDARIAPVPAKASALLGALAGRGGRRAVVFTRFRDTLDEIVSIVLAHAPDLAVGTYSGDGGALPDPREGRLVARDRDEVRAALQAGLLDLVVCTDAASEGLNLQGAGLLVNYDLPWNPSKVEQRIGRIDRIGQEHDEVEVVNMLYQGSAEERVYARLLARLDAIGTVVGSQQISLIPLHEGDFLALASADVPEARKEAIVARAQEAALAAARRAEAREMPPRLLFALYWREAEREATRRVPARLGDLWRALATSPSLARLGFSPRADGAGLDLPDGLLGRTPHMLTIDRALHAVGMAPDRTRTAFATWGDPVVESVFRLFSEKPLPPFARRLEVSVHVGMREVPVVGYAVATPFGPRLLTALDDIEALGVDPSGTVDAAEAEALMPELEALARLEYAAARDVAEVERRSEERSRERRRTVEAVAAALLDGCCGDGSFEAEVSAIEARVSSRRDGPMVFAARVDEAVAAEMPGMFTPMAKGTPGRYRVSVDALTVRSAIAHAREVRESIRKGDASGVAEVAARILVSLGSRRSPPAGVAQPASGAPLLARPGA